MNARVVFSVMIVFASVLFYIPTAFAQDMLITNDIYVNSVVPSQTSWDIKTVSDKQVSFYCDKTEQSVFDMGKTTVRCIASDEDGNESRISFVVTVGYDVVQIPGWFEQPTQFWLDGIVSDAEYAASIESLMRQELLHIPTAQFEGGSTQEIPVWIKQNSQKWIDQELTDDEFSIGLQWMIKHF